MDIRIRSAAAAGALSAAMLWGSCGFFRSEDAVRVLWPETPVKAFGTEGTAHWTLRWYAADGSVRSRRVQAEEQPLITVEREIPLIAAAVPRAAADHGAWSSRPAGFAAPVHEAPRDRVRLTWEGGFAAAFLLDLAEAGVPPQRINIERFNQAVLKRAQKRPWELDARRLASDTAGGRLGFFSFRVPRQRELTLPLPQGLWYSAYPPDPPIQAGPKGWGGPLGLGLHAFLNPAASLTALVHVQGTGPPTVLVESLRRNGPVDARDVPFPRNGPVDARSTPFLQPAVHLGERPAPEEPPGRRERRRMGR